MDITWCVPPQHLYKPEEDHIVTAASCTTNCLAPVVKVGCRLLLLLLPCVVCLMYSSPDYIT
jgi:hypothetical protein